MAANPDSLDLVPAWTNGLAAMNADKPGIATTQRDFVITQVAAGKLVKHVAEELGVHNAAISMALSADPDYQQARKTGCEQRLDTYQDAMDTAPDGLSLARAREGFRAQSWRAEREHPDRWGREPLVNIAASGNVQIAIVSFAEIEPGK